VASAVLNAVHHLDDADTGRPDLWVQAMLDLADEVTSVRALLDAGVVAAWRCGLARLRSTALAVASTMDATTLGLALGTDESVDLALLADDPWRDPAATAAGRLLVVRRLGAFRGFGGTFAIPPTVSHVDGRWYAGDGTGCWQLHADRFGAALTRVAQPPSGAGPTSTLRLERGRVSDGTDHLDVPELADVTSWAASGGTLAATTRWTHSVLFVARTAG
jgi:hypothetical protein